MSLYFHCSVYTFTEWVIVGILFVIFGVSAFLGVRYFRKDRSSKFILLLFSLYIDRMDFVGILCIIFDLSSFLSVCYFKRDVSGKCILSMFCVYIDWIFFIEML